MTTNSLLTRFTDDFSGDTLDSSRWTILQMSGKSNISVGEKTAKIRAVTPAKAGPGVMAYGGIATTTRQFNPGLKGTNLFEVGFVDYTHDDEFLNKYLTFDGAASDREDPASGLYLMGFCLAIGTFQGLVGSEPDRGKERVAHRVVQIHCDLFSRFGLGFCLNRNLLPGEKEKYPIFDNKNKEHMALARAGRTLDCPHVTIPGNSVSLAIRHNPSGDNIPWGHRWGLMIGDNGNTLSWLLDGKVMDTVNISDFFSSSPGCVAEGAYATIVAAGSYRENVWKIADVRIKTSE